MAYEPESPPQRIEYVPEWLERELRRISNEFRVGTMGRVEFLNAAPTRLETGMVRGADGTNWNPGSGRGVYWYDGTAWEKLSDTAAPAPFLRKFTGTLALTSGTSTTVSFPTVEFDDDALTTATNFTPTVPGYYQVQSNLYVTGPLSIALIRVYKNGLEQVREQLNIQGGTQSISAWGAGVGSVCFMNGTTDTVTVGVEIVGTTPQLGRSTFSGHFIRGV